MSNIRWRMEVREDRTEEALRALAIAAHGYVSESTQRAYSISEASAPELTGALRLSHSWVIQRKPFRTLGWVWVDNEASVHAEYGTTHMAAQPYFRPMVETMRRGFVNGFKRYFVW